MAGGVAAKSVVRAVFLCSQRTYKRRHARPRVIWITRCRTSPPAHMDMVVPVVVELPFRVADAAPHRSELVFPEGLGRIPDVVVVADQLTVEPPATDAVGRIVGRVVDDEPLDPVPRADSDLNVVYVRFEPL